MPVCLDKIIDQEGRLLWRIQSPFFTAFYKYMYFIENSIFFLMSPQNFQNSFFSKCESIIRPLTSTFFCLEYEEQDIKLVWPKGQILKETVPISFSVSLSVTKCCYVKDSVHKIQYLTLIPDNGEMLTED